MRNAIYQINQLLFWHLKFFICNFSVIFFFFVIWNSMHVKEWNHLTNFERNKEKTWPKHLSNFFFSRINPQSWKYFTKSIGKKVNTHQNVKTLIDYKSFTSISLFVFFLHIWMLLFGMVFILFLLSRTNPIKVIAMRSTTCNIVQLYRNCTHTHVL